MCLKISRISAVFVPLLLEVLAWMRFNPLKRRINYAEFELHFDDFEKKRFCWY